MKVDVLGHQVDIAFRPDNPLYWTVGALLGAGFVGKVLGWWLGRQRLNGKRNKKRKQRQEALKRLEDSVRQAKLSNSQIQEIICLNLSTLQAKLKSGELKPTQVLKAYQAQAWEAQKQTNCLVEPIIEAEDWAAELERRGNRDGSLYGVPVSIKDNYSIKGYDSTIGCSNWIDQPCADDAVIVKVLKAEGAIPFVKTNVPQTMISYETTNPIFGATTNCQDKMRGAGGSSGGEGALIGCGGSPLGMGSDIGGSIRIPASMNGIYGFKPTAGRISGKGTFSLLKGQVNVQSVYGPLARDVDSLATSMRVLCSPTAWALDSTIPPVPFNMETYSSKGKKLKIGVLVNDPYLDAVPAMQRAVRETEQTLRQLGHEVEPWFMEGLGEQVSRTFGMSLLGDGGTTLRELLKNDKTDSSTLPLLIGLYMPGWLKYLLALLIRPMWKEIAMTIDISRQKYDVADWWALTAETTEMQQRVIEDWQSRGLDAVISPGFTCLPLPLGQAAFATGATLYTFMYNMLNFPAGSLPVTRVTADDVANMADYPTPNPWQKTVKKGMAGTEGLIVNVQVATLPWKEELCLNIMKQVQDKVQFKRD